MRNLWVGVTLWLAAGLAFAQTPSITSGVPSQSFLGESFCFDTTLTNTGSPGYGPYLRLVLPPELSFGSAEIFGASATVISLGNFPAAPGNQLTDPFTGTSVTGPAGSSFRIIELPVGSVVTGNPPLTTEICLTIQPAALVGTPYPVGLTPVYRYGDTPTGANGPIVGVSPTQTVTPTVLLFEKTDSAPESERPPGPSWPVTYTLTANIANTATINPITFSDTLPANAQYTGPITITGGVGCAIVTTPSTVLPGGTLEVTCSGNTVGTTSATDIVVSYPVHYTDVLDETNCGRSSATNAASAAATYVPVVGAPQVLPVLNAQTTVELEHFSLQKAAAPGSVVPGDNVTYTLSGQVTDFGSVTNLVVTDVLSDGLLYDSGAGATVSVNGGPAQAVVPVVVNDGAPNYTQTLTFDIGAVTGALIAGTSITISYQAEVQAVYADPADGPVRASDDLPNTVTSAYDTVQGATACSEGSAASVGIVPLTISKSILNPQPAYGPGDTVTYVLTMNIPSGDTRLIQFSDYFPLPVFKVADIDTIFGTGDIRLGAAHTLGGGFVPLSISVDVAQNALFVQWPDVVSTTGEVIQIEVDVTVTDDPFADDLFLTNLFRAQTANTPGLQATETTPVQIRVRAPELVITKGVLSTGGNGVIAPPAATLPVNGNITSVDAGDSVTWQVTIENIGGDSAIDVRVTDTPPAGLTSCVLGGVTYGDGSALGSSGDLFTTGLLLAAPLAGNDGNPVGGGAPYGTDTALVTYTCSMAATVAPTQVITNTVTAVYSSVPGGPTFPSISDTATATVRSVSLAKSAVASSEAHTTDSPLRLAVGEVLRYRLAVQVPEGLTVDMRVFDVLPVGLTFLNDNSARAVFVSNGTGLSSSTLAGIADISGSAASAATTPLTGEFDLGAASAVQVGSATLTCSPPGSFASGTDVCFRLGDITNADNDNDNEFVVVEFNAIVDNTTTGSNDAGDGRANTFRLGTGTTSLGTSNSVSATVVEPVITVNKVASPTAGDAGDTINYTVTLTAAGGANNSTAFDVAMSDVLPASVVLNVGSVSTSTSGAIGLVTNASAGNTVSLTVASMAPGSVLTITYSGTLQPSVAPGTNVNNTATATWTSLPGASGTAGNPTTSNTPGAAGSDTGERTGSGSPAQNDHTHSDGATVAISQVQLAKVVFATSDAASGSAQHNVAQPDVLIGETVTYRVTATLPEGSTPQVVISDTLPYSNGVMQVVSASVISVGSNLSPTNASPAPTISDAQLADGINDTVSFDFGATTNTADGVSNGNDQIVVEIVALLRNLPVNVNGDALTNTALVQFGPGLNASANAIVDVVEPQLQIAKSGDVSSGDAGDAVLFTLVVSHASGSRADALDAVLSDVIPANMTYVGGSLTHTGGVAPTSFAEAGGTITALWDSLALGQTSTLQFSVTLDNTVVPGTTETNTAGVGWTSLTANGDPNERVYSASDNHGVLITQSGLIKTVFSTSEPSTGTAQFGVEPDLTIGETVTYRFTVTLSEGTTPGAVVFDQLPTGSVALEAVSGSIVATGSNLSGAGLAAAPVLSNTNADAFNDRVTWNLGDVLNAPDGVATAADELVFEVVARVVDVAVNQGGVNDQVNTATLQVGASTVSGTALIDIVEPEVLLTKAVTDPADGFVDAGNTVTVLLTLDHSAASSADAFNLVLADTLPSPGLSWINNATVSSTCAGLVTDSSAAPLIVFSVPTLALATDSCTISYQVLVDTLVNPTQSYTNSAVLEYDSQPVFTAGLTRRQSSSDTASVTVLAPSLVKVTSATSLGDTGTNQFGIGVEDLAIGETVTYTLTAVLPEGTIPNTVITDLMPANPAVGLIEVIGGSVAGVGANISTTLPGTLTLDDFQTADGINDRARFAFGTVTNTPNGVSDAGDRIEITVVGRVIDVAANAAGDVLVNTGQLSYSTGPTLSDTADVDVVEPLIALDKGMTPAGNGTVRIALSLTNTGTAPAYDLAVQDVLIDTLWNLGSIAPVSVPSGFELVQVPAAGQVTVIFRSLPAAPPTNSVEPGETVTATFDVALASLPPATNPVPNSANTSAGSSLPGTDPEERDLPPRNDNATLGFPNLIASKNSVRQIDADSSGNNSPGDTLRYTIVVTNNGAGAASGVVLTDVPDANGALVVGSVTTTQGSITAGNGGGDTSVAVNIGTIAAGASVTVRYDVTIDNPLPVGVTQLVNQGTVNSNELPSVPTDDPDEPGSSDPTVEPVVAAPDMTISKSDGGASTVPGGTVAYTLNYSNVGNQHATGVVLSETVPVHTSFNAGASTAGWSCVPSSAAGSTCSLAVGAVNAGAGGSVTFAVTVVPSVPVAVTQIANTATVADDGSNGVDPTPANNTASDTTPLNATPDLTITKSDGGATTVPGGSVSYALNYSNVGNQDASGVVLTETVPAHSSFNAGASTAGWSCLPDGNAGSTCTLAVGNLAVGASGTATFAVTVVNPLPAGIDQLSNTASVADDGSNGADPTPANNSSSDTTPITAAPDLTLDKDDGGSSSFAGGVISYTLSYANVGNQGATGVLISETVPANVSFNAGASTAGWACVPSAAAGSTCTLGIGALAAGGSGSAVFAVTVDNPLPASVTDIANTASIADDGSNGSDPTPVNNTDSDTTPVGATPDLTIVKTDGGATGVPGGTVAYTLDYANVGTQGATGVVITETVPTHSSFNAGASTAGWVCTPNGNAGSTCTLAVGALVGGANGSAVFAVTVVDPLPSGVTQIANTASIADDGDNGADPTPANNSSSDDTPINATPDLNIVKTDGGVSTVPGGVVTYTLNYANVGDQDATGVVLTETVPTHSSFNAASSSAGWTCVPSGAAGSICTLSIGNLAAGASGSRNFAVTVVDPLPAGITQIANTASIADDGSNGADPNPSDNSSSDDTPVAATPDLTLQKDDGDARSRAGEVVVYTLSYSNVGDQDATGVVITDTVPANTRFVTAGSSAGWSCANLAPAGTACNLSIGNLAAGASGSVTFAVQIDDPLPAGVTFVTNTASIADDGSNGADPTPADNSDDDSTPVSLLPPVGLKEGVVTDVREGAIEWTMWWFNPNNTANLPVFIYDAIPANSTYRSGTVSCTATGASQCLSATYNAALNRIEVLAIIAPDFGAAPDSRPEALSNEIVIRFTATSVASGTRYNQGLANWDENNDGDPLDDRDDGQDPVVTDDPLTPDPEDPTGVPIQIVRVIPAFGDTGRGVLLLSILLIGGLVLRRRLH